MRCALEVVSNVSAKQRRPLSDDDLDALAASVMVVAESNFRDFLAAAQQEEEDKTTICSSGCCWSGDVNMKLRLCAAALALCGIAGCAPQQQTAMPPSPTGCYYVIRHRAVIFGNVFERPPQYEPAPCNWVNSNAPIVMQRGDGGGDTLPSAAEMQQQQMEQQQQWNEQQQFLNQNRPQFCVHTGGMTEMCP